MKARFGDGWISRRHSPDPSNLFGGLAERQKVLLVKPITYMNNSGEAVGPLMRYFDVTPVNLLVIHDDLDLASAQLRLRLAQRLLELGDFELKLGGDGGHGISGFEPGAAGGPGCRRWR